MNALQRLRVIVSSFTGGRIWSEHHPRTAFMQPKDRLALRGEALAETELRRKGYEIVARGWRWHRYEIDLIARKGNTVAIVEVKTRTGDRFGTPQEAVPRWKQKRIATAARVFIRKHRLEGCLTRFDIMAIVVREETAVRIEHIENAFQSLKS
jgi:putative endonuclease